MASLEMKIYFHLYLCKSLSFLNVSVIWQDPKAMTEEKLILSLWYYSMIHEAFLLEYYKIRQKDQNAETAEKIPF